MTYWNPVLSFGIDVTCKKAVECGVDGFIVVDLPVDEAIRPLPFSAFKAAQENKEGNDDDETAADNSRMGDSFVDLCNKYLLGYVPLVSCKMQNLWEVLIMQETLILRLRLLLQRHWVEHNK